MFKSIIKEISILLLLVLAIALILGVLFYEKVPASKIIPTPVAYTTPDDVKQELKEEILENNTEVIVTYQIEDTDLRLYQAQGSYNKGKANPFADYVEPVTNTQTNSENGQVSTSTSTNTNTSGTETNTNDVGNFYDKPLNK